MESDFFEICADFVRKNGQSGLILVFTFWLLRTMVQHFITKDVLKDDKFTKSFDKNSEALQRNSEVMQQIHTVQMQLVASNTELVKTVDRLDDFTRDAHRIVLASMASNRQ